MRTGNGTVLYYNPQKPAYLTRLKGILVQMGVRIRIISDLQTCQKVGFLAGINGFEEQPKAEAQPVIPHEMLVMEGFNATSMDRLFAAMRRAKIPGIALKAVVTPTNAGWTFYELYEELKKEHEQMTGGKAIAVSRDEKEYTCET